MKTALGKYTTTVDLDEKLLKKNLGSNKRHCIRHRRNEKALLLYFIQCAEKI
jgi:hypothetical protein